MKTYRVKVSSGMVGRLGVIVLFTAHGEIRRRWLFQATTVEFPYFEEGFITGHRVEWV